MELSFFLFFSVFLSSILSAMGLGGGNLLLLYLNLFSPLSPIEAQQLNLFLFLPTAAFSLLLHRKHGFIQITTLKKLLPSGMLGACLGSAAAACLEAFWLRKCFAVFLLVVGGKELYAWWQSYQKQKRRHKV